MLDNYLRNAFIKDLLNPECQYQVKIANPKTLVVAYILAKN